ncbi:hypothetical protein LF1_27400 [Rubripirellula obstinata]|uniref:3-keto-alpha-glucoside-1,2-lyase/3-keto-2-hydroxy-glucal hydratase domain-containing protein n=1 Tax=Rubripirellula obstinata TaxID=406547 RepID=A0A5B1CIX0_9BACT|nr:DUF1080 domain-containing protein [Rubripirellula obstinata]KAA1260201.1 hypothetical protein LF1_27400 [Rubripirellula obstinata]
MNKLILLFVLALPHSIALADDFADSSVQLFDGQTLAGWEGDAYWFRVEDKSIVAGRIDQAIPHNVFLCTTANYDDFELRLDVKLVRADESEPGPNAGPNAGVQFRSKRIPGDTEVSGYQADAGEAWGRSVWGALFDESRRKQMLAEGDPELVERLTKPDDWNSLRIVCRGQHVQIFLNGQQTVDYIEEDKDIPVYGMIGLQIHSGPATEAWYRNIRIRQFQ